MPRTTKLLTFLTAALAPCLITGAGPAFAADETYSVSAKVTIPNNPASNPNNILASWDISFVDPTLGQFFLGDRTNKQVDIVNTGTNTFVTGAGTNLFAGAVAAATCQARPGGAPGVTPGPNDCNGPNGVIVTNHNELWVSDGNSTMKVFDLTKPGIPLIATISLNGVFRGDEVCFNPEQQQVMVASNSQADHNSATNTNGPFATIISVKSKKIVKQIPFDGSRGGPVATNGAEQCSYSRVTERFYITLPGVNNPDDGTGAVVVINPEDLDDKKLIEKTFNLKKADCDTPQGTAVGPGTQLLVGCNGNGSTTHSSVVIDQRNGNILATIADESGPDEVWYNPGDGSYFLARSAPAATTQLLGVIDARGLKADASSFTAPLPSTGAGNPASHSVAADPVKNQIYVTVGGRASTATACGAAGDALTKSGCIAVFTAVGKDDQCLAEGAPVREANAGEDAVFMNGRCRDNDRHDHDRDRDR
jgi:hypothetical protein